MKHLGRSYSTLCWTFSFDILSFVNPPPLHSQAFVAMQSIILAMGSVGQEKLACAIRVETKHLERSYSTLCCSISDILSFVTPLPCVHRHLWQCNPLCLRWGLWVKRTLHVQWGLKWSIWREVIQLYAAQFPIFGPLSPHPPAFTGICGNAIHYACDGVCWSREACTCYKSWNEAFGEKLFNFMLLNFRYFVLCHPTPHQTIVDLRFFYS